MKGYEGKRDRERERDQKGTVKRLRGREGVEGGSDEGTGMERKG